MKLTDVEVSRPQIDHAIQVAGSFGTRHLQCHSHTRCYGASMSALLNSGHPPHRPKSSNHFRWDVGDLDWIKYGPV